MRMMNMVSLEVTGAYAEVNGLYLDGCIIIVCTAWELC